MMTSVMELSPLCLGGWRKCGVHQKVADQWGGGLKELVWYFALEGYCDILYFTEQQPIVCR